MVPGLRIRKAIGWGIRLAIPYRPAVSPSRPKKPNAQADLLPVHIREHCPT